MCASSHHVCLFGTTIREILDKISFSSFSLLTVQDLVLRHSATGTEAGFFLSSLPTIIITLSGLTLYIYSEHLASMVYLSVPEISTLHFHLDTKLS
jgi:hypothetical protein